MIVQSSSNNIIHLHAESQYELCRTFLRPQEFYEGEFKEVKGNVFTLEEYMDLYAEKHGNFTYLSDWGGFNIPSNVYEEFLSRFVLCQKERRMANLVNSHKPKGRYYIIGTYGEGSALDHELAHAKYYLNDRYRDHVDYLTNNLPYSAFLAIKNYLLDTGYCEDVIYDEIQAYIGTSSKAYLDKIYSGLYLYRADYKLAIKEHI
jgi:hypothetical protein